MFPKRGNRSQQMNSLSSVGTSRWARSGRLMVTAAAVLGSTRQVGAARGQCDSAASLEAYNGLAGVDVEVRAMVAWDPDGTAGPAPNLMVLGGQFERAGNLTGVHGR